MTTQPLTLLRLPVRAANLVLCVSLNPSTNRSVRRSGPNTGVKSLFLLGNLNTLYGPVLNSEQLSFAPLKVKAKKNQRRGSGVYSCLCQIHGRGNLCAQCCGPAVFISFHRPQRKLERCTETMRHSKAPSRVQTQESMPMQWLLRFATSDRRLARLSNFW